CWRESQLGHLITYLLFGNIWMAFKKLRLGKLEEAEDLVNQIKWPSWLSRQHRAYYHFIKGMIALQKKELPEGEKHLITAMDIGLRTPNDKALVALNLAHICYVGKRVEDSKNYLGQAKSFNSNDLMIRQNIEHLEKVLDSPPFPRDLLN
ncbi:MAG: hypothetical protein AAFP19_26345, partial [Bacteroidota bacterium]